MEKKKIKTNKKPKKIVYSVKTRTTKPVIYHGRKGLPTIHMSESGKKYIMVRKKGGGVRRLYEGSKYKENNKIIKLKL